MQIHLGTKVRFTREFLRNTTQFTGTLPFMGGPVVAIKPLGEQRLVTFRDPLVGNWTALEANLEPYT